MSFRRWALRPHRIRVSHPCGAEWKDGGATTQGTGVHPSEGDLQPLGTIAHLFPLCATRGGEREGGPPGNGTQPQRRALERPAPLASALLSGVRELGKQTARKPTSGDTKTGLSAKRGNKMATAREGARERTNCQRRHP